MCKQIFIFILMDQLIGAIVNEYQFIKLLGTGSMAE